MEITTSIANPTSSNKNNEDKSPNTTRSLNDNSNPQQGTGNRLNVLLATTSSTTPSNTSPNITKVPAVGPTNKSYTPLKVPPSVKDHRKVFVGGLPSDVTCEEFRQFFEQYGKVEDSVVMYDRNTGRSRGFGFVTFEDPAICRNLTGGGEFGTTGRLEMRGKTVEVKTAEPKPRHQQRQAYNRQQQAMTPTSPYAASYKNSPYGNGPPPPSPPQFYPPYQGGYIPGMFYPYTPPYSPNPQPQQQQGPALLPPPPLFHNPSYEQQYHQPPTYPTFYNDAAQFGSPYYSANDDSTAPFPFQNNNENDETS